MMEEELDSEFTVGTFVPVWSPCSALTCSACTPTHRLPAGAEPQQGRQSRRLPLCPLRASRIQSSQLPNGDVILPWHRGGEMLTKTTSNVPRPQCECTQKKIVLRNFNLHLNLQKKMHLISLSNALYISI